MKYLIISTLLIFVGCFISTPLHWRYSVGDCLMQDSDQIVYKVTEVGKYSLKVKRPRYNGYEEIVLKRSSVDTSEKVDCFNMFDDKENN